MGVRRFVAALLLVPVLVSCSDDEPGSEPKDPVSSPTVTESPEPQGPVEPVLPEAAKKPTKAGAVAFLEYYWAMVDYAEATGQIDQLEVLALPGCKRCVGGLRFLRRMADASGRIIGEPRTVQRAQVQIGTFGDDPVATVRATIVIPPSVEFYGKAHPKNKRWPGGRSAFEFVLRRSLDSSSWQIAQWTDAP